MDQRPHHDSLSLVEVGDRVELGPDCELAQRFINAQVDVAGQRVGLVVVEFGTDEETYRHNGHEVVEPHGHAESL